jgi:hypothetical protein
MQNWHSTCLGRRTLPRDLSAVEIGAFFNFSDTVRRVIEDWRGPALKLALAAADRFSAHDRAATQNGAHRAAGTVAASGGATRRGCAGSCIAAINVSTSSHAVRVPGSCHILMSSIRVSHSIGEGASRPVRNHAGCCGAPIGMPPSPMLAGEISDRRIWMWGRDTFRAI